MRNVVFVTGTGTEIGKTWVTAAVIERLRSTGSEVHARKPAQSFERGAGPTDAEILAAASGEDATEVCPRHRWYAEPLAPPMAADLLGEPPIAIAGLIEDLRLPRAGSIFVEGAGGLRSPIADDGDNLALADAIPAHTILLVADADLGTINSVNLCHDALQGRNVVTFLNRYDASRDIHRRNLEWLRDVDGYEVLVDLDELTDRLRTEAG